MTHPMRSTATTQGAQRQPHPRLEPLYREHQAFVWRCVRRLGLPREQVDDAVQDVFLVADRRLETWEPRGSIRSWLFAIAMRVVQQHRRTEVRHRRRVEALADHTASTRRSGSDATEAVLLQQLLERLDDGHRAVFVLAELERMTAPEIAGALGINANTVYSRLRSARARLREAADRIERGRV